MQIRRSEIRSIVQEEFERVLTFLNCNSHNVENKANDDSIENPENETKINMEEWPHTPASRVEDFGAWFDEINDKNDRQGLVQESVVEMLNQRFRN